MDADYYRSGSSGGAGGGGGGHAAWGGGHPQTHPHPQHMHQHQQAQSQQQQQHQQHQKQQQSQSMTIDEMRQLHRSALTDAESKRTELRLVLASRYRELVGSSDEVTHMRERAGELGELVSALPGLVERVAECAGEVAVAERRDGGSGSGGDASVPLDPALVERVVLCSGKLALELQAAAAKVAATSEG